MASDFKQDFDDLFCETCGDCDWEIGEYENMEEAWGLLKNETDIFGTGGYSLCSVCSFITGISLEEYNDVEMLKEISLALGGE